MGSYHHGAGGHDSVAEPREAISLAGVRTYVLIVCLDAIFSEDVLVGHGIAVDTFVVGVECYVHVANVGGLVLPGAKGETFVGSSGNVWARIT